MTCRTARKPPETHQPTKAEMEEVIVVDGTPDEIAAAVLRGGFDGKRLPNRRRNRRRATTGWAMTR